MECRRRCPFEALESVKGGACLVGPLNEKRILKDRNLPEQKENIHLKRGILVDLCTHPLQNK